MSQQPPGLGVVGLTLRQGFCQKLPIGNLSKRDSHPRGVLGSEETMAMTYLGSWFLNSESQSSVTRNLLPYSF